MEVTDLSDLLYGVGIGVVIGLLLGMLARWIGKLWGRKGEIIVICAWCDKEMYRKPGLGQTGVSHGICSECRQEHFPQIPRDKESR